MNNNVLGKAAMYGVYMALVLIILSVLTYLLGLKHDNTAVQILTWTVVVGGLFYGMMRYRKDALGGFGSWGQLFTGGTILITVSSIINSVYSYIYFVYINPNIIDEIKEKTYNDMISGGYSEEQAVQAFQMTEPFLEPGTITIIALVVFVIVGIALSAIYALIIKKENPNPFDSLDAGVTE